MHILIDKIGEEPTDSIIKTSTDVSALKTSRLMEEEIEQIKPLKDPGTAELQ